LLPPRSNGKPEAAAAVDVLLMMAIGMPETCSAVFKGQTINLQLIAASSWLIHLNDTTTLHFILISGRKQVKSIKKRNYNTK
jgi:hypothetical protein